MNSNQSFQQYPQNNDPSLVRGGYHSNNNQNNTGNLSNILNPTQPWNVNFDTKFQQRKADFNTFPSIHQNIQRKCPPQTQKKIKYGIFCSCVPTQATSQDIRKTFGHLGPINSLKVRTKKGKAGMGYAIFSTPSKDMFDYMVSMSHELLGETIYCRAYYSGKDKSKYLEDLNSRRIFIRNIPIRLKDPQIFKIFERFGQVERAYAIRDEEGNSLGYGYVNFASKFQADKILQLQKLQIGLGEVIFCEAYKKSDNRHQGKGFKSIPGLELSPLNQVNQMNGQYNTQSNEPKEQTPQQLHVLLWKNLGTNQPKKKKYQERALNISYQAQNLKEVKPIPLLPANDILKNFQFEQPADDSTFKQNQGKNIFLSSSNQSSNPKNTNGNSSGSSLEKDYSGIKNFPGGVNLSGIEMIDQKERKRNLRNFRNYDSNEYHFQSNNSQIKQDAIQNNHSYPQRSNSQFSQRASNAIFSEDIQGGSNNGEYVTTPYPTMQTDMKGNMSVCRYDYPQIESRVQPTFSSINQKNYQNYSQQQKFEQVNNFEEEEVSQSWNNQRHFNGSVLSSDNFSTSHIKSINGQEMYDLTSNMSVSQRSCQLSQQPQQFVRRGKDWYPDQTDQDKVDFQGNLSPEQIAKMEANNKEQKWSQVFSITQILNNQSSNSLTNIRYRLNKMNDIQKTYFREITEQKLKTINQRNQLTI